MNLKMDKYFLVLTSINSALGVAVNFVFCKFFMYKGPAFTWILIEFLNLLGFFFIAIRIKKIPILSQKYFSIPYNAVLVRTRVRLFFKFLQKM